MKRGNLQDFGANVMYEISTDVKKLYLIYKVKNQNLQRTNIGR